MYSAFKLYILKSFCLIFIENSFQQLSNYVLTVNIYFLDQYEALNKNFQLLYKEIS